MVNVRILIAVPVAAAGLLAGAFGITDLGDAKTVFLGLSPERSKGPDQQLEPIAPSEPKAQVAPTMPKSPTLDTQPKAIASLPVATTEPKREATDAAGFQQPEPAPKTASIQESSAPKAFTGQASMANVRKAIRARDFASAAAMLNALGDDAEAQYMLATLYRKGDGVTQDDARAFDLMSAAADAGHLEAQFSLARMYISGRGVEADQGFAQLLLAQAAEAGHVGATEALVTLMSQTNPPEAPEPEPAAPQIAVSDMAGKRGKSPLMEVAERGEVRVLRRMLEMGMIAQERDEKGRTPLMLAAAGGHGEAVQFLMDHGADPRAADNDGRTALMHAALSGGAEVLRTLDPDDDVRALRDNKGLLASDHAFLGARCTNGVALYSGAVATEAEAAIIENCSMADLKALSIAGHRFKSEDGRGRSPVWYAAQAGNLDSVRFLIEAGYALDDPNLSPLLVAINSAHSEIAAFLIESGADSQAMTRSGNTALLIAATRGLPEVARLLIDHGADIDHRNQDGYTALMLAAKYGREDIAGILVSVGADASLRNTKREQAFDIAEAAGFVKITALLE